MMTVKEMYELAVKDEQETLVNTINYLVRDKQVLRLHDTTEKMNEVLSQTSNEELLNSKRFEKEMPMQANVEVIINHFKGDVMISQLKNSFPEATDEEIARGVYEWLKKQND